MTALIKDKSSLEWNQVKDYCTRQLDELRVENDGPLDLVETARIRGMIEMAKKVIALGIEEPTIQIVKIDYID